MLSMNTPTTKTVTLHPIVKALLTARDFIDEATWKPQTDKQKQFFMFYSALVKELKNFSNEEIKGLASKDAKVLNAFLKENNFDIKLDDFNSEEFGSVGILKAAVSWLTKGKKVLRTYDELNYEFACLSDANTFQVFDTFYEYPVIRIKTVNEDEVFICKANESFSELDLLSHTSKIQQDISQNNVQQKYESVTFPCLKIKDEPDISWLKGLLLESNKPNNDYLISSAKQQTKFEMDENGAKVESAAAVVMVRSCRVLKHLVIDDSAHVWISRKNCDVPYFAARVEKDSWVKAQ